MADFICLYRFLWVVLQLDCLCKTDIETDDSIRRSLQDMPRDLYTLFSRILQRAKVTGHSFQNRLLRILVAAQHPLTLDEMREALSIVPADAAWRPQQQLNNIAHALASCGSLITVDEEEGTVRFIHQSVSQFLLQDADSEATSDWHFTSGEASLELGELLVTYLSYGFFDQELSTVVVPSIPVGKAPTAVVQNLLKDGSWRKIAALKLLRLQSQRDPDLGRTITEVSGAYHRSSKTHEVFHLLAYARKYWLVHTRTISSESLTFSLWKDLLTHPVLAEGLHKASRGSVDLLPHERLVRHKLNKVRIFDPNQTSVKYWTDIYDTKGRYIVCNFNPVVMWAVTNSHLGMLSFEMKGKRRLRTLCGIIVYLLALQKTKVRPLLERLMWDQLRKLASALGMKGLADDIFQLIHEGEGRLAEQYALDELHRVERRTYFSMSRRSRRPASQGSTRALLDFD